MQPQIEHGKWWQVESEDGLYTYVPHDLVPVNFSDTPQDKHLELLQRFNDYVEGIPSEAKEIEGWGARLSMPGYTDCTPWIVLECEALAREYLIEQYDVTACELCDKFLSDEEDGCPSHCEDCAEHDDNDRILQTEGYELTKIVYYQNDVVLKLYDANERDSSGRWGVRYELSQKGEVIFPRTNSPVFGHHAVDGIEAIKNVMGWLTLRPGDTDEEYFKDYTEAQLDFANTHGENLTIEVLDRFGEC